MTRFVLDNDTLGIVISFLWPTVTIQDVLRDFEVYKKWHETVPIRYLRITVKFKNKWFHTVPNPYRANYQYTPRKFLSNCPLEIWGDDLPCLAQALSREGIRSIRTYKKCAMRWVRECTSNLHPELYNTLKEKLLLKLTPQVFCPHFSKQFLAYLLEPLSF